MTKKKVAKKKTVKKKSTKKKTVKKKTVQKKTAKKKTVKKKTVKKKSAKKKTAKKKSAKKKTAKKKTVKKKTKKATQKVMKKVMKKGEKKSTKKNVPKKKTVKKKVVQEEKKSDAKKTKRINLNHITKIEGHASLKIKIEQGIIKEVDLYSEEGARFFEGLVVGRNTDDTVEMTSRICGICSTAHVTAALKALEATTDTTTSRATMLMREMLAIGERIRSHATHIYFLVLPDYMGYESALQMAAKYKKEIGWALALMKLGNTMIEVFGGRQIHPVGSVVGGMTLTPKKEHLALLGELLKECEPHAFETIKLFASLPYPDFERETEYFSLEHHGSIPLFTTAIESSTGRRYREEDYKIYFKEYIDTRGTSKFAVKDGKGYRVGSLARINNHAYMIPAKAKAILKKHNLSFPSHNPFHGSIAQALEIYFWLERAKKILARNEWPTKKEEPVKNMRLGHGVGAVEAPRGILYHEYWTDQHGKVTKANIMTPTVQNLRAMEDDIRAYLPQLLDLPKDRIAFEIEKLIRAYDPCFSCSTHFLDVKWDEQ